MADKSLGEQYFANLCKALAGERSSALDIMKIPEEEYLFALEEAGDTIAALLDAKRSEIRDRVVG